MKQLPAIAVTLVALFTCAAPAAADVVAEPPALHVIGQRSAITTSGAPTYAHYDLRNVGSHPLEVFVFRAVVRDGGTNHPMTIDGVEVGGRAAGRTLTVPAGGTLRVRVSFTLPEALRRRGSWEIELRVTSSRGYTTEPARISRAHRDRVRKLVAGVPKARS